MIVFIDSGVLGILTNPNNIDEANECKQWLYGLLAKGVYICSSDLCDYEVRRSLILASHRKPEIRGIQNLDNFREVITFLEPTSVLLKQASSVWASARIQGIPTANEKNLDVDIIICTHYQMLQEEFPGRYIVIATTNVKHLSRFAEAKVWRSITI